MRWNARDRWTEAMMFLFNPIFLAPGPIVRPPCKLSKSPVPFPALLVRATRLLHCLPPVGFRDDQDPLDDQAAQGVELGIPRGANSGLSSQRPFRDVPGVQACQSL